MIFYGNDIVWDKENNKPLCQFVNGEYEAKNNREIEILYSLGYKHDESEQVEIEEEIKELDSDLYIPMPPKEEHEIKILIDSIEKAKAPKIIEEKPKGKKVKK